MTKTAALAVAAAVAPLAMAAGCTCGGPFGPGIEWCDYCLATIDCRPVIRVKPNRSPTSGREITARYEEAQRLYAAFPPISSMSRDLAAEMLDVMRSVYDVPRVVALA